MNINKSEKQFIKIVLVLIVGFIINLIVINPIENKKLNLQIKKQEVVNKLNDDNDKKQKNVNTDKPKSKDDIVLKIEKSLRDIVKINYISKNINLGEDNNISNIELKVIGNIDEVFKIGDKLKNLNLDKFVENLEIRKASINNEEDNIVECIMTLKVV
ncbi:hypothetical protein CHF27_003530 [Romboutsia maritimum]|uniref:Uncharacterized protein n=1 Tax=Romboutsia maritimum TaxID=2020948 RepID=A0A371IVF4_9FIRM|nr:hypothetical protein [Romboutsia maritimum]RDY24439.1 hypothetical protein CHF27_003530 [Romboutsia maritimum]